MLVHYTGLREKDCKPDIYISWQIIIKQVIKAIRVTKLPLIKGMKRNEQICLGSIS